MFWFKRKIITLDCFTTDPFAYQFAPIVPAVKHYPDWFTELPSTLTVTVGSRDDPAKTRLHQINTIKHCRGFLDIFKSSYIIPFWGQLEVLVGDLDLVGYQWEANYNLHCDKKQVEEHYRKQYSGFVDEKYRNLKLQSPWKIKTNKYVKFLISDPVWCRRELNQYTLLPGVVDFKYQSGSNFNLMVECLNEKRIINFEPNTPLAMMTALTENQIAIKCHLVDDIEMNKVMPFDRIDIPWASAASKYPRSKKFIDKIDEQNKPKCPFGFGK